MMFAALLLRPWALIMRQANAIPALLADDILLYAKGPNMLQDFSSALTRTHTYLQDLGATISMSKSYNFASTLPARTWLARSFNVSPSVSASGLMFSLISGRPRS